MKAYIDKSALVAEIERRNVLCRKVALDLRTQENKDYYQGKAEAYKEVLDILNTLEVKEANEDLRTEYEKGRDDVIAKTIEWINVFNDNNYIMQYSDSCEHPINEIIEWYKNYINRE